MKEGMPILQHLNDFNRILSDLLAPEVKLEEEDKALLLLSSLSSSYGYLATTIMYGKKALKLEDVGRFYGWGLRIVCQGPEGKIKE